MAARIPRAEGPPASPRISEHKGVTTAETMTVLDKQHKADGLKVTQRLKHFNRKLVFIMMYMAFCALNFGYDVGTFAGVQAMQSFTKEFGVYNEKRKLYMLPSWLASVMVATPFLGKALGTISCGWIAEKWGRRAAVFWLCVSSLVGVILQVSAQTAAQFTIGRVVTFIQTGMAIVVIPIYQAETAPKILRGSFGSTIQIMIVFGSLVASLVTYGTKDISGAKGWQIPIGLQLIMPVLILVLLPLLPESPRWLLSQDRQDDAYINLRILRKGASEQEIGLEMESIATSHLDIHKGTWVDVFNEKNRKRTAIAVLAMFGQQVTGQAFPSQYGVIFYQSQGFRNEAFLFQVIGAVISLVAVVITWFYVDVVGRRPVLLIGGSMMAVFLFILAGLGTGENLSGPERNSVVAALLLFSFSFNLSWAPVAYVVVSEVADLRVKEKTNLLACVISVLTTFVTSFSTPYLINEDYANLGAKVGYIYGSTNVTMVILTYFFIPELKGRTLEEVDELFETDMPLRKFGRVKTTIELYENRLTESEMTDCGSASIMK